MNLTYLRLKYKLHIYVALTETITRLSIILHLHNNQTNKSQTHPRRKHDKTPFVYVLFGQNDGISGC